MASARLIRRASSQRTQGATTPSAAEEELRPLLSGERAVTLEPDEDPIDPQLHFYPNPFADLPVYDSIWKIRRDILDAVNDPYSYEQLRAPRLNTAVVRPLLEKYYALQDLSIVFCLLVNRAQFLADAGYRAHYQSVRTTRAALCEILAHRLLRQYDEDTSGPDGLLLLANIVIAGFDPFQNCPKDISEQGARTLNWGFQDRGGYENQITALEIAIISESKLFLSGAACQKVIDAIYTGRVVYTPTTFVDILPDWYKHKPISIYNPRKAPLLNTYRLSVPRIRSMLEVAHFVILLALYIVLMSAKKPDYLALEESVFIVYTFGWILDQCASMLEHGWQVYSHNLWSFLDVTFASIFIVYFILRMDGLTKDGPTNKSPALDFLALGAPFLVPRLAFNIFSENLLLVSLRDMMSKFLLLTFLAVWSFAGFFMAMIWLDLEDGADISPITTAMWMVWVWFGLDGTGIAESPKFHKTMGPLLMVAFAILGNTLFLTVLVSTLSDSYSKIARYAKAEIQFRRAVLTFEGVKSDAIFAYWPPFNILALTILLPLKLVLSPRWFHKVNVTAVRLLNAPILLIIGLWERRYLWPSAHDSDRKWNTKWFWAGFSWLHVHGDVHAVFEAPPPGFVDKPSDKLQSRRRKSWRMCAPGEEEQNETVMHKVTSTATGFAQGEGEATSESSRKPSETTEQQSSLPKRRDSKGKDVSARLERIEEMLEAIVADDEEDDA